MIGKAVRLRLRRLLTLLAIPLVAAGTTVVLSAAPAHAALVFQGNFSIRIGNAQGLCATVANNGTADRTPIQLASCNGSNAQRWAIFFVSEQNAYWIQAYGGQQPLNKCMDKGEDRMWIYGCHGGTQQRWRLNPTTPFAQQIQTTLGDLQCVGTTNSGTSVGTQLAQQFCIQSFPPFAAIAPFWQLVPA